MQIRNCFYKGRTTTLYSKDGENLFEDMQCKIPAKTYDYDGITLSIFRLGLGLWYIFFFLYILPF